MILSTISTGRILNGSGIFILREYLITRIRTNRSEHIKTLCTVSKARLNSDQRHTQTEGHTTANDGYKRPKIVDYLKYNERFANVPKLNKLNRSKDWFSSSKEASKEEDGTSNALIVLVIAMFGISFACVPLYEYFCQQSGYLGTTKRTKTYSPPPENSNLRKFEIDFVTHSHINWEFKPCQKRVVVRPGETTLSFYRAKNLTKEPIIGIAAYHVIPDEAGLYFNKIQCFCFEEQLLNPGEEVDLPVLFFLDPDIVKDKKLHGVDKITLSYIFFEANSEIPPEYKVQFK